MKEGCNRGDGLGGERYSREEPIDCIEKELENDYKGTLSHLSFQPALEFIY